MSLTPSVFKKSKLLEKDSAPSNILAISIKPMVFQMNIIFDQSALRWKANIYLTKVGLLLASLKIFLKQALFFL